MDSVIKVLLQLGRDDGGKDTPSEKEISTVVCRFEREGVCADRFDDVLKPRKRDEISLALAQHAATARKANELKIRGLLLGMLGTAIEEGEANGAARQPLGAAPSDSYRRSALQCEGQAGEAGGNVSCRDPEAATQPSAPPGSVCALEGVLPPYRDPSPARGASAVRGALPPYPDPSLPLPRAERPCADGRACGAARGRCGDDKEGRTSRDGDGDGERSYQGGGKGGLTDWGK